MYPSGLRPPMARKARPRKAPRTRSRPSRRLSPVPPGYPDVIPYLSVTEGVEALEFYVKAFGAKELVRNLAPDGKLIHGRLRIGRSIVMLSDVFPGADTASPATVGTTTVRLHLYCKDVDAVWNRAVAAGAIVTMPLDNQFWGERYGHLRDPYGHHWSLSMRVKMSAAERAAKQQEAMAAFSRGEHPGQDPPYGDA
jgi:PhnB protein